ncbi:MAG TPA: alpha/beta hydrolase [Ktedonobacteraceae bacterium]|nr:alpha/beta hydrolase [Ktedonobacteraceae bacterium]
MHLKVNGTRLFFDVVGSHLEPVGDAMRPKPTLIMLHGGPGFDHSYFRPAMDPLGEVAQVIYLDERGQGRSARHSNDYYQLGIMADDVAAFFDELSIEKPVVLGDSFGGFVALSLAVRHPDLAAGLILISTLPWWNGYDLDALEALAGKDLREVAARELAGEASEEDMRRFFAEVFPYYYMQFKPEYLSMLNRTIMNEDIDLYMNRSLRTEYDMRPHLAGITIPSLVLHGRHDWVTPFAEAEKMAQALPQAHLHVLEHSGHMVQDDEPEEVIKAIREFLLGIGA